MQRPSQVGVVKASPRRRGSNLGANQMRKSTFALTCAAAAMVASAALAQDPRPGIGNGQSCKKSPPGSGEQLCIDDGTEASRGRLSPRTSGSAGDATLAPAPPVYSPRVY